MSETSELRIREAVRALVIDDDQQVLLVRFEFPAGTRWALPGGGLDVGESHLDALRRELREEIGLDDPVIGAHLWNRLHIIPFINGLFDGQREQVYEVRVASAFQPRPSFTWEQLNAEYVFELRWWSMPELEEAQLTTAPRDLVAVLRDYLAFGPPSAPIDVAP